MNGKVADLTVGPAPPPEIRQPVAGEEPVDLSLVDEEPVPPVDETMVRSALMACGGALGFVVGDEDVPGHWRFTKDELDQLTPPMTRIVNRNVKLRRAVIRGDEMTVAVGLGTYMGRNVRDAQRAKKVRRERDGEAALAEGDARTQGPGLDGGGVFGGMGSGDGDFHDGPSGGGLG